MMSMFWVEIGDVKTRMKTQKSSRSNSRKYPKAECPQTAQAYREPRIAESGMRRIQSAHNFRQIAAHQSISERDTARVFGRPTSSPSDKKNGSKWTGKTHNSPIPEDVSDSSYEERDSPSREGELSEAREERPRESEGHSSSELSEKSETQISEPVLADEGGNTLSQRLEMAKNLGLFLTNLCDEAEKLHDDEYLNSQAKLHLPFAATKVFKNIDQFVSKLCQEVAFDEACLVHVMAYIERVQRHSKVVVSWYNIHRLVLTGLMVSDRMLSDDYKSGDMFARVTGSPVAQMRAMQRSLLGLIDYNACVLAGQYSAYEKWLCGGQSKECASS